MVRLTVLKNAGYGRHEFDHWERDCASFAANPVCTVRADGNMVVVAVFRRIR